MTKLETILENLKKKYGKGAILQIGQVLEGIETISTGSLTLNKQLGVGGLPKGRIVEIYGNASVGKSTLCCQIIAEAQKNNGVCVYIDFENALDLDYAKKLGVKVEEESGLFLLSQPESAEQGMDIVEQVVQTNEVAVVVVDSVAAMVTETELSGEVEDANIALTARLMSKMMRRLVGMVNRSNTLVVFVNQLRDSIGVMGYGEKTITTGGKALPYYSSVRINLTRIGQVKDGENIIGARIKAKIVKNKVASPFKEAEFDLIFGEGISQEREIIELGSKSGLFSKSGTWLNYKSDNGEDFKWQGVKKASEDLRNNFELKQELINKLCH